MTCSGIWGVEMAWFSTLHREVFSGYSGFPSPQKPAFDLTSFLLIVNFSYSFSSGGTYEFYWLDLRS